MSFTSSIILYHLFHFILFYSLQTIHPDKQLINCTISIIVMQVLFQKFLRFPALFFCVFYRIRFFFTIWINSWLSLVLANIFRIFSTASSVRIPLIAFRMMPTASYSSLSKSRSSLLVPDFTISIAGNTRFSDNLRSKTSSILPVPLNSS